MSYVFAYTDAHEPGIAEYPEDENRDYDEEHYWREFCVPCGASPCTWDGTPDGFHADEPGPQGPAAMCAGCFGRNITEPHDCQGDPCWCLCRYGNEPLPPLPDPAGHAHDGGCTWAGCGFGEPPDTLREMREDA